MKSIEENCADFILRYCRGPEYRDYRRRCIEFWRETYGEQAVKRIEVLVKAGWKK